jgi:hypothetical protein
MMFINKLALNGVHLYITAIEGTIPRLSYILSIALVVLFIGSCISRVLVIPHFNPVIKWGVRLNEALCACLLIILSVCHISLINNTTDESVAEYIPS